MLWKKSNFAKNLDMALVFEWDNNKAKSNILKHRVPFEEATSIFGDRNSLTIKDVSIHFTKKDL